MKRRDKGFTLVEVLIAFAILSLVLIGVFRSLALGQRGANEQALQTTALRLAESKLEVLGISEAIAPGQKSGRFDDRFRWEMNVTPYGSLNPSTFEAAKRPHWVTLTVL